LHCLTGQTPNTMLSNVSEIMTAWRYMIRSIIIIIIIIIMPLPP